MASSFSWSVMSSLSSLARIRRHLLYTARFFGVRPVGSPLSIAATTASWSYTSGFSGPVSEVVSAAVSGVVSGVVSCWGRGDT